jgi:hypothetical protein
MGAGDQVLAVSIGFRQVLEDEPHAFDSDAVGHRMIARRAIGLEAVGERVHAGAGGDEARHANRQFRIGDDDRRQQFRVEDDLLGVGRLIGDDAGAADLRTGAGCRRHGDDRCDRVGIGARPPVADIFEIPDRPDLAGLEGNQLAEIERRAAAEGDDAVMLALLERGDAGGQVRIHRVRPDLGEHAIGHLGVVEDLQRRSDDRQFGQAWIGDEERPLDAGCIKHIRQFLDAPRAEADGCRVVPFGNQFGHFCLSKKSDGFAQMV